MKTEFTVITPLGEWKPRDCDLPELPTYEQLRAILDPIFDGQRKGATFEHVSILHPNIGRTDMFVDEIGATIGLAVNEAATRLYHNASIARGEAHENGIIPGAPKIHGRVVVFHRRVWF